MKNVHYLLCLLATLFGQVSQLVMSQRAPHRYWPQVSDHTSLHLLRPACLLPTSKQFEGPLILKIKLSLIAGGCKHKAK